LTDTSLCIYIRVKHFGVANIKVRVPFFVWVSKYGRSVSDSTHLGHSACSGGEWIQGVIVRFWNARHWNFTSCLWLWVLRRFEYSSLLCLQCEAVKGGQSITGLLGTNGGLLGTNGGLLGTNGEVLGTNGEHNTVGRNVGNTRLLSQKISVIPNAKRNCKLQQIRTASVNKLLAS